MARSKISGCKRLGEREGRAATTHGLGGSKMTLDDPAMTDAVHLCVCPNPQNVQPPE